jgi:hypothetical protein
VSFSIYYLDLHSPRNETNRRICKTETTVSFLKDAVLDGDWDSLATPSSRLVVGKLGTMGTGSFDVLTRVPTEYKVAAF